jgi:hypothetical protein
VQLHGSNETENQKNEAIQFWQRQNGKREKRSETEESAVSCESEDETSQIAWSSSG